MSKVKYRVREFTPKANQGGAHSWFAEAVIDNDITNNPEWLDRWLEAVELVDITHGYHIHCEPPWGFNDKAFQRSLQRKNRCCENLRKQIIKEKEGKKGGIFALFKRFCRK